MSSYKKIYDGEDIIRESREMEEMEKKHDEAFQNFLNSEDDNQRKRRFEKLKDAGRRGKMGLSLFRV